MPTKTRIETIYFVFFPCSICLYGEEYDESSNASATIEDIQELGWPICSECGNDLEIAPFAVVEDF